MHRHTDIVSSYSSITSTPMLTREDLSIVFEDGKYFVRLSISSVTSYFPMRTPTEEEVRKFADVGDYLKLTSDAKEWEPNSSKFEELESRLVNRYGELKEGVTSKV